MTGRFARSLIPPGILLFVAQGILLFVAQAVRADRGGNGTNLADADLKLAAANVPVTVFHPHSGTDASPAMGHRIPGLIFDSTHGVLLAFAEGRVTCDDYPAPHHLVMARSLDRGRSCSPSTVIFNASQAFAGGAAWDPTPVFDERNGAVHVLFSLSRAGADEGLGPTPPHPSTAELRILTSVDAGIQWHMTNITSNCMRVPGSTFSGGHGIQLSGGDRRLIVGMYNYAVLPSAWVCYSIDGETWTTEGTVPLRGRVSEGEVVEVVHRHSSSSIDAAQWTPRLLMHLRRDDSMGSECGHGVWHCAFLAVSEDLGLTWQPGRPQPQLMEPPAKGGICRLTAAGAGSGGDALVESSADSWPLPRGNEPEANQTVHLSYDGGVSWPRKLRVDRVSGYSTVISIPEAVGGREVIGTLYEAGLVPPYTDLTSCTIRFARVDPATIPAAPPLPDPGLPPMPPTPMPTHAGLECQARLDAFCNNLTQNNDCCDMVQNESHCTIRGRVATPFWARFDRNSDPALRWRCYSHLALTADHKHWSADAPDPAALCTNPPRHGGGLQTVCAHCQAAPPNLPAGAPCLPLPPPPPPSPNGVSIIDVFTPGDVSVGCTSNHAKRRLKCQYDGFRIPGLVNAGGNTLIAFAEGRKYSSGDFGPGDAGMGQHDMVMRRSTDDGRSFGALTTIIDARDFEPWKRFDTEAGGDRGNAVWDPTPLYDRQTSTVWLFFNGPGREGADCAAGLCSTWASKSTNFGISWTTKNVTASCQRRRNSTDWSKGSNTPGNGHGIQLSNGMLIVPMYGGQPQGASLCYSNSHGAHWNATPWSANVGLNSDEIEVAELRPTKGSARPQLYMTIRNDDSLPDGACCPRSEGGRQFSVSSDFGQSWSPRLNVQVPDPGGKGSVINDIRGGNLILSTPACCVNRVNMSLFLSKKNGRPGSFVYHQHIHSSGGYSTLAMTDSGDIALLFEQEWAIDTSKPGIPAGSHAVKGSGKISLATVAPGTIIKKGASAVSCSDAHCPLFPPPPPPAVNPSVGFCRAPPPPPPLSPSPLRCGQFNISLTQQLSDTKCLANTTFGCASNVSMWVKGCTGMFSCCGRKIHCESLKYARHECRCDHDTPPPTPPGVSSATVTVTSDVVAITANGFVSITLDGYTESWECQLANGTGHDCRNGGGNEDGNRQATWRIGNWENAPLADDAPLATWVAALAQPSRDTVLRIGGGPTEHVIFAHGNYSYSKQVNGRSGYCNATTHAYGNEYNIGKPDGWPYTLGGDCVLLTPSRWQEILRFCDRAKCKVVWAINSMYGSCCSRLPASDHMGYKTGHCGSIDVMNTHKCLPWDSSNARSLLEFTRALPQSMQPFGFELGNENIWARRSGQRSAAEIVDMFRQLAQMIAEIWAGVPEVERPKLIGPDEDFTMSDYISNLGVLRNLTSLAVPLHSFTYHSYDGGPPYTAPGLDAAYGAPSKIIRSVMPVVKRFGPTTEMWLGEGGGIGSSGVGGISNAFWSSIYYADTLGNLAKNGQQRFLRQTIAGGHYGLTNLTTSPPSVNPDFYVGLLFARLMGPQVLAVSVTQQLADPEFPLRGYGHCARSVGVALLLINLHRTQAVNVTRIQLSEYPESDLVARRQTVYRLQPAKEGDLHATSVRLNGALLSLGQDGALPPMAGVMQDDETLLIGPMDIVFVVVEGIFAACDQPYRETH